MHFTKKLEKMLSNYHLYKLSLQMGLGLLEPKVTPLYQYRPSQRSNTVISPTETHLLNVANLERHLQEKQAFVHILDQSLRCLTLDQRKIIEFTYLYEPEKRLTLEKIGDRLGFSERWVSRHKKLALLTMFQVLQPFLYLIDQEECV